MLQQQPQQQVLSGQLQQLDLQAREMAAQPRFPTLATSAALLQDASSLTASLLPATEASSSSKALSSNLSALS